MEMLYVAVLVFSMLACGHGQKTMNVENTTYVEIMASGFKMMASKQMNISADKNALTVELEGLKEMKNATIMGSMLNLTGLTLTAGEPTDVAAGVNAVASRQIVSVSGATSVLGGKLTLTFDIFKKAGVITRGTEKINVTTGDVKISAKLETYTFPNGVETLTLSLSIGGFKAAPSMKEDEKAFGAAYDLGGDGIVGLSKKAMQGNNYVDVMPAMNGKMMTVSFNQSDGATPIEYSIVLRPATVFTSSDGGGSDPGSSTRVVSLGFYLWFLLLVHRILW